MRCFASVVVTIVNDSNRKCANFFSALIMVSDVCSFYKQHATQHDTSVNWTTDRTQLQDDGVRNETQVPNVIWQKAASPTCYSIPIAAANAFVRSWPWPKTWFLGPTWISPQTASRSQNGMSIGSAVFAQYIRVTKTHKHTHRPRHVAHVTLCCNKQHSYAMHVMQSKNIGLLMYTRAHKW